MATLESLLGVTLNTGLTAVGKLRQPARRGSLRLAGLAAPVDVIRDRWGVPHIYAENVRDLLFAQGFVHAQDRLWQMDFQRRLAAGRLAEVLGAAALPSDRGMRILGLRRVAEAEVGLLNADARTEMAAYTAGVNACIAHQPLPVEFGLLRYRPERWTLVDSLSWAKVLSWWLSANWETELLRAALIERLGPALAAELEPPAPPRWPTVMPSREPPQLAVNPGASNPVRRIPGQGTPDRTGDAADLPPSGSALGSNNWVVAGWRSTTGMPLLANDMHLAMGAPAIWYENHLVVTNNRGAIESIPSGATGSILNGATESILNGAGGGAPAQSKDAALPDGRSAPSTAWPEPHGHSAQGAPLAHYPPGRWPQGQDNSVQKDAAEGDLNVTGVSFLGIPYVVAGHNGHVAWGFTNGYPDVQDLFMERLRRTDDGRVQYQYRDEWLNAEVRQEVIRVKGGEPVTEEVIVTHHGPIINALAIGLAATLTPSLSPSQAGPDDATDPTAALRYPLALRWTALDPDHIIHALRAMNRARSCTEFSEALRDWSTPVQNAVHADTQGNIAYSYPGRVPIRAQGDGRVPAPGWTGEHEWLGYVPFDELPSQFNPASGYIASANNRVADASFPHFLSHDFATGDRAERIVELLAHRPQADLAFFRQMQFDQVSSSMRTVAGYLGQLKADEADLAAVVALIRRWNGRLTADSPAATICKVFSRLMMQTILEHKLGDLAGRALGRGPTPALQEWSFFSQRTWEWLLHILTLPHSGWFDLGHGEQRDDVMLIALRSTLAYLRGRLGPARPPHFEAWAWGRLHTITFAHIAGRVPALSRHFNRGPFPLGGDGSTIWATGNGLTPADSTGVVGPPFRFLADLGDLDHCLGLLVPGNSGRPGSRHYDDQIDAWFSGDYHPMLYARQDVEHEATAKLSMQPKPQRA